MVDYLGTDLELKSVSVPQRLIAGYAAVHHSVDRVKDIIDPSASVKAVNRLSAPSDVGVFIGHRADSLPIGIPQKIEATNKGLYTETYILKGPAGDNLLAVAKDLMDHGQSLGLSIGYKTHDSRRERAGDKMIRRLMDFSLKEFSYAASQAIAHPEALVSSVKSRRRVEQEQKGTAMQYRVEHDLQTDRWLVYADADADGDEDDNVLIGTYESQEIANAVATALRMQQRADDGAGEGDANDEASAPEGQADKSQPPDTDTSVKATWSTAHVNSLKNEAFLFLEPGEDDDEGKRVPRSKRHFPYKDADGKVDVPHLRAAIARIPQADVPGLDDGKKAQLQARARRLLAKAQGSDGKTADLSGEEPDEWKAGAPLEVCGLGYRLIDLSEQLASELKAMALLGDEVKGYRRIRAPLRAEIAAVVKDLGKLLEFAETCERGEDGQQRLAYLRQQLALTEV